MTGAHRVVSIGPGGHEAVSDEFLLTEEAEGSPAPIEESEPLAEEWAWDEPAPSPTKDRFGQAAVLIAPLLTASWTAAFVWSKRAALAAGASLDQSISWIADWSMPVILVGVVWLLIMRNSRREAARFGDAARLLADESCKLETRLVSVNSELSLAREFIAAQARDLDALGRVASDRLSQSADRLQSLIQANSGQVEAIGGVSEAALENMEKLRGQLPVIANSARDVTNNIGNAGRTAHAQLQEMISGFKRLNEFGQASESQVESLRQLVAATLAELRAESVQLESVATRRFASMTDQGTQFREQLEAYETEAMTGIRARAQALAGEIDRTRGALDAQEADSLVALRTRIDVLRQECSAVSETLDQGEAAALAGLTGRLSLIDEEIASRQQRQQEHARSAAAEGEALAAQMQALEQRIEAIAELARNTGQDLGQSVTGLTERLSAGRALLTGADGEIADLTDASVRLLELIQASSQHSREQIPAALTEAEKRLALVEQRIESLRSSATDVVGLGEALQHQLEASQQGLVAATSQLDAMHERLGTAAGTHSIVLERLRQSLAAIETQSAGLATRAQVELSAAIDQLAKASHDVVAGIEGRSAATITRIAERLGDDSKAAIDKVIQQRSAELAGQLEKAAARAAEVSREATIQLRDQLAKVDNLAGNLERRVAYARERAEEQIDNDFARRVALITESLNSNGIDIARALDTDVSDTAWAAYLKGDRGIFTRRAVNLLETGEGREIIKLYDDDSDFREHVNRYIHDFEAMLRQILSTRDGHALGVTLLSSNMGKLYVALAQAIERLRS